MLFLYDLPIWLLGVVIVGTILALSYASYFAFHRVCRPAFTEDHRNLAMAVLSMVATVNSLLLAFSAVSVWESFASADEAVAQEADTIGALGRDLALYDSSESREARRLLREYAEIVVKKEWPEMQRGVASTDGWSGFDRFFRAIGSLQPDTPRRTIILSEIWARANELLRERRDRLYTSQSEVPATLWVVVLIGTMLTMATTFVLPPTRFNLAMIGVMALSIGLVFYLVVAMDRPFAGEESVGPAPFELAIDNMRRWDAETANGNPTPSAQSATSSEGEPARTP